MHHHPNLALMLEFLFEHLGTMHRQPSLGEHFKAEDARNNLKVIEDVLHDRISKDCTTTVTPASSSST